MATTWTETSFPSAKAVCTSGSESAPTLVTHGLSLDGVGSVGVQVETQADAFAAGTLQCYLWNVVTGIWNRAPDLDLAVSVGLLGQAFGGIKVDGPVGRIAYLPDSLATICTVYLIGTRRDR